MDKTQGRTRIACEECRKNKRKVISATSGRCPSNLLACSAMEINQFAPCVRSPANPAFISQKHLASTLAARPILALKLLTVLPKAQVCRRGSHYTSGVTDQESEIRGNAISKDIRTERIPWRWVDALI